MLGCFSAAALVSSTAQVLLTLEITPSTRRKPPAVSTAAAPGPTAAIAPEAETADAAAGTRVGVEVEGG